MSVDTVFVQGAGFAAEVAQGQWYAEPDSYGFGARLLALLPDEVYATDDVSADGFIPTLFGALGRELARMQAAFDAEQAQGFIPTVTYHAGEWEQQLGLRLAPTLTLAARRQRLLARRRGWERPAGPILREVVRDAVGGSDAPTLHVGPGKHDIYKLYDRGWPGDDPFDDAERRVNLAGPAAFGHYVAAWNELAGLTRHQLNKMARAALGVLTRAEMNGP